MMNGRETNNKQEGSQLLSSGSGGRSSPLSNMNGAVAGGLSSSTDSTVSNGILRGAASHDNGRSGYSGRLQPSSEHSTDSSGVLGAASGSLPAQQLSSISGVRWGSSSLPGERRGSSSSSGTGSLLPTGDSTNRQFGTAQYTSSVTDRLRNAALQPNPLKEKVKVLFSSKEEQDFVKNLLLLIASATKEADKKNIFLYSINCLEGAEFASLLSSDGGAVVPVSYSLVVGLAAKAAAVQKTFYRVLFRFGVRADGNQSYVIKDVLLSAAVMAAGPAQPLKVEPLLSYEEEPKAWAVAADCTTLVTRQDYTTAEATYFVKSGMETWKNKKLHLFQHSGDFEVTPQPVDFWKMLQGSMKGLPTSGEPVLRCVSKEDFEKFAKAAFAEHAGPALKFDRDEVKKLAAAAVKGVEGKAVSLEFPKQGYVSDARGVLVEVQGDGTEKEIGEDGSRVTTFVLEVENITSQKVEAIVKYHDKKQEDKDWKASEFIVRIVPGVLSAGALDDNYEVPQSLTMTCGAAELSQSLSSTGPAKADLGEEEQQPAEQGQAAEVEKRLEEAKKQLTAEKEKREGVEKRLAEEKQHREEAEKQLKAEKEQR
ncbi:MAG: hypothetical protein ACTJLL_04275, partial [Anaplasma sp.]